MKRFLIPATLLLILLIGWGCGNSDNILAPEQDKEVLAAPIPRMKMPQTYYEEGWIGPAGGTISVGETKAIYPKGALDSDIHITVEVELYHAEGKIHYTFGPHGTVFKEPVRLEMPWSYLGDYDGPLQLWYLEENGEWVLVEDAVIEETTKSCIVYVEHFSQYYFPRP